MAEIGVWRGEFAAEILRQCEGVDRYYLVGPWRHLDNWETPANRNDDAFETIRREALDRTNFARHRFTELRGTTSENIDEIPDGSLDFASIDGDHTLRGITLDLALVAPKVRPGGWIGGDDFVADLWHHGPGFEPTQVFPYAVYFAEATGGTITAVGHGQFLLEMKHEHPWGGFQDLTGSYPPATVLGARGASSIETAIWRVRCLPQRVVARWRRR